jgi:hypothetical protein
MQEDAGSSGRLWRYPALLGEAYREQGIEEDFLVHPMVQELQHASLCSFQLTSGPQRITYQEPPIALR